MMKRSLSFGMRLGIVGMAIAGACGPFSVAWAVTSGEKSSGTPETVAEVEDNRPSQKFDASNQQLLYQMALTDGTAGADVSSGFHTELQAKRATPQNTQMAGEAAECCACDCS